MNSLDRQFKISNASITDPLFNIDKTIITSTNPHYDPIGTKSFKFVSTMFHLQQQTGVPNFCSKTSGKGMDTIYLVEAAKDPDNSVIIYNTPTDETNAVMVYNYSVDENAMHILAFCVNQEIDFGIPGWKFMNEFKDIARDAGMSAIILESVDSALAFYKKQGFKVDKTKVGVTGADSEGLYPMESHYRGKWSSPAHSKSKSTSRKRSSSLIKKLSSSLSSPIRKKSSKSSSQKNLMDDSDISSFSLSSHSGGGKKHNVILIQLDPNIGSKDKYFVYNPSTHKRQRFDARPTKKSTRYGDDFLTGSEYERMMGSTPISTSSNKKTRKTRK